MTDSNRNLPALHDRVKAKLPLVAGAGALFVGIDLAFGFIGPITLALLAGGSGLLAREFFKKPKNARAHVGVVRNSESSNGLGRNRSF